MKKLVLGLLLFVGLGVFSLSHPAFALTGDQCVAKGGQCSKACASGQKELGACDSTVISHCCQTAAPATTPQCGGQCVLSSKGCATGETANKNKTCPDTGKTNTDLVCCETPAQAAASNAAASSTAGAQNVSINLTNPLQYDTVDSLLTAVLGAIQKIVAILALVFIVIGALLYITSAGNEGRIKLAKNAITAALIGFAIAIAAPSFLKEIAVILNWGNVNNAQVEGALTLSQIATNVLSFLLSLVGILALIMLIIGAIMYFFAAGNETRQKAAKNIVIASLIGITIALASLVLITQIAKFFSPS